MMCLWLICGHYKVAGESPNSGSPYQIVIVRRNSSSLDILLMRKDPPFDLEYIYYDLHSRTCRTTWQHWSLIALQHSEMLMKSFLLLTSLTVSHQPRSVVTWAPCSILSPDMRSTIIKASGWNGRTQVSSE